MRPIVVDRRRAAPLRAFVRGLASGAVGTAAMTAYQEAVQRLERRGRTDEEWSPAEDPWQDAPAPAQVAKRLIEGVFQREVPPERIELLSHVTHWTYGAFWGGVYGLVRGTFEAPATRTGLGFGSALWALSYVELVPMGIYEPPWRYDAKTLATDLSYHLVYGVAVAHAYERMERL